MSTQAENCIDLLSGQNPDKVLQALKSLRSEVVQELMNYYQVKDKEELADKLYLLGYQDRIIWHLFGILKKLQVINQ